ncbi:MAG TPA: PQQ-dependent sugar dehydrogenase [Longimicrobiaceae bacterium]|nr:PQQ-dependent sugar dehydrogenase [Longimicrobiaceae bacterium]
MVALLSKPLFRARVRRCAVLLPLLALPGCNGATDPGEEPGEQVRLQEVASGLENPLYLTAPAADPRLFIVEQPGRIRIVRDGNVLATSFLDIRDRVGSGGERGLLSMAFHPQYATNGFFYVNYTDLAGDTRIERYRVGSDADLADPASATLVLAVEQPYANHNGGLIKFGPDGMLYVGMGDGGSGGDPLGHGQNRGTLLGALLRIDVSRGDPYAIPPDNPFVGQSGARGEIWAYGLRNPWRFSFDRQTGQLYLADVGQNAIEEVNVVGGSEAGLNYGWSVMEGSQCYGASSCNSQGMVLPVIEYGTRSEGCAVTGGYVYRGRAIPGIAGHYFYGDYCRGWIRSFRYANGQAAQQRSWELDEVGNILSFGEDAAGELYLLSANGRVYQFVRGG